MPLFETVRRPHCGEAFATRVEAVPGNQEYIEDCQVCCRPIVFRVKAGADGRLLDVESRRDDD